MAYLKLTMKDVNKEIITFIFVLHKKTVIMIDVNKIIVKSTR